VPALRHSAIQGMAIPKNPGVQALHLHQ